MRSRRGMVAGVGVLCVLLIVLVALALVHFGQFLPQQGSPQPAGVTVIARENTQRGAGDWIIPAGKGDSSAIQAYAGAASVLPGQRLSFYVSTMKPGTPYTLNVYRLGWYGGVGARLLFSRAHLSGNAQGYYNTSAARLIHCRTCNVDTRTGLVEARWQTSYILAVPMDWVTGIYLAKFIDSSGFQTYVPFDVRGNAHATYIVITPDATYQAYNDWGGYSLYQAASPIGIGRFSRGVKVSFNRPYAEGYGASQIPGMQIDAIRWLERQGYDLAYASDLDLQRDPGLLMSHQAYLSIGHDEYWTKEMRDAVEAARNQGVGLAFLGANAAYWQIRLAPDTHGKPERTIVCYKVQTGQDLWLDPYYGKDNTRVTAQWRDPVLHRPENALIGVMFSHFINQDVPGYSWRVSVSADSSLLDGTGLSPGQTYGCNLVGYEWDRVFANGFSPPGLQILSISSAEDDGHQPDISNSTYYVAASGALVFATGSTYWTTALDDFRFYRSSFCQDQGHAIPQIQHLMANVMLALCTHHQLSDLQEVRSSR